MAADRSKQRGGFGRPFLLGSFLAGAATLCFFWSPDAMTQRHPDTLRIATFNVSMYRDTQGALHADLARGDDAQIRGIAQVLQTVRPDVVLLNEFDYDEANATRNVELFLENYLRHGQGTQQPLDFAYSFSAPVNTGVPSGLDLDRDGRSDGPSDALGFGRFPGQYGMLLLSRLPIDSEQVRSFRNFLWRDMPGNLLPPDQNSPNWYSEAALRVLPLSSKSHWDLPLRWSAADGTTTVLHVLAAHPTPPGFDGPENRNGRRNHDEIRLFADYLDPVRGNYLIDDRGRSGALDAQARFVILGDLNADPYDGNSVPGAISQLLDHPRVHREAALGSLVPRSEGGVQAAERQAGSNARHRGDPAHDTADFGDGENSPGNLRVDYVLPSNDLQVCGSGVYWPVDSPSGPEASSDHRLVWVDLALPGHPCNE